MTVALDRWLRWLEWHPVHQKAVGLFLVSHTPGCRFDPWSRHAWEATD